VGWRSRGRRAALGAGARPPRGDALAIAGFAALAAVLLVATLGNQYLWEDEAQTALLARSILAHGIPYGTDGVHSFSQEQGAELGPGGVWRWHTWLSFYAVALSFALLGESAFAARLPFALCGAACVAATGLLARELFRDRIAAGAAAGLLALSVPFLILARQARWYALAALLAALGLTAYQRLAPGRRGPALALLAAALLLFHTHFLYSAILLPTLLLHATLVERGKLRAVLLVSAATGALAAPWLAWLSGVELGAAYARRLASPARALELARWYADDLASVFLAGGFLLLPAPVLALRRVLRGEGWWPRGLGPPLLLVGLHTAVGLALLALLAPGHYVRYATPLVPPLFAVAGLLVGALARAWPAAGAVLVAAWLATGPLDRFVYELTHDFDGPIEGLVRFLRANARPGDRIAIVYGDLPLKFYTDLRVFGGLTGEDLEPARGAEWIVLRRHDVSPVNRRVREVLRGYLAEGDHRRHRLDVPDTAFENREDPTQHAFRTIEGEPRLEVFERRR
jgi:hypothetical protein